MQGGEATALLPPPIRRGCHVRRELQHICVLSHLLIHYANSLQAILVHKPTSRPPRLADALTARERQGQLHVSQDELATQLGVSPAAVRQALYRQMWRGRVARTSRGTGHWLIVPTQYAESAAPPLASWLNRYLAGTLRTAYYVSLLSAAECYGASPYAVMTTQVAVPHARRPLTVGRTRLVFHVQSALSDRPTQWHETADGRYRVSTPGLTALELVEREQQLGGIARVTAVLAALAPAITQGGLKEALVVAKTVPAVQRLGYLMQQVGASHLARVAQRWLATRKTRAVALSPHAPPPPGLADPLFKIRAALDFDSNT